MSTRPLPAMTPADVERFWSKVDRSGGPEACWPWIAGCTADGYGSIRLRISRGRWGSYRAPRVALFIASSLADSGTFVCHTCDNRRCCNPTHLFSATQAENLLDMRQKGRGSPMPRPIRKPLGRGSRLNSARVASMRERYQQGESIASLMRSFGVSRNHTTRVVKGGAWKSVGGAVCASL